MNEKHNNDQINIIWKQKDIPVIYRKHDGSVLVRLPYIQNNRNWLQNNKRIKPKWNSERKYWEIPKSWFNETIERSLDLFKKYI